MYIPTLFKQGIPLKIKQLYGLSNEKDLTMEERNTPTLEELNAIMIDLDSKIFRIENQLEDLKNCMYRVTSLIFYPANLEDWVNPQEVMDTYFNNWNWNH